MAADVFRLLIMNSKRVFYDEEINSAIFEGDDSEFEILPFHSPLIGVLRKGFVHVNGKLKIPVEKGAVKFFENDCVVLAEQAEVEDEASDFTAEEFEEDE